jgi:hypothetical protein
MFYLVSGSGGLFHWTQGTVVTSGEGLRTQMRVPKTTGRILGREFDIPTRHRSGCTSLRKLLQNQHFEQHQRVYRLSTRLTLALFGVELLQTLAKGFPRNDLIQVTQSVFALFKSLTTFLESSKSFSHDAVLIDNICLSVSHGTCPFFNFHPKIFLFFEFTLKRLCIFNYYFSANSAEGDKYYHSTSFRGFPGEFGKDLLLRANAQLRTAVKSLTGTFFGSVVSKGHFRKHDN